MKYEVTKKSIAEEYEPVRMDTSEDKGKIEVHSVKNLSRNLQMYN